MPSDEVKHTPGPWVLGKYDAHAGYDCMTGGVRAGPVVLDAGNYGQSWSAIKCDCGDVMRLMADARLIAAAPDMLAALRHAEAFIAGAEPRLAQDRDEAVNLTLPYIRAAIAKATGAA